MLDERGVIAEAVLIDEGLIRLMLGRERLLAVPIVHIRPRDLFAGEVALCGVPPARLITYHRSLHLFRRLSLFAGVLALTDAHGFQPSGFGGGCEHGCLSALPNKRTVVLMM